MRRREEILQYVQTLRDASEDLKVAGLRLKEASFILLGVERATSNQ